MNVEFVPGKQTYAGLFTITLATLMYEILLTRIFSVVLWYHFAFVAISIALFGMTVGAIFVYLVPCPRAAVRAYLASSALFFGVSTIASFIVYLGIPFTADAPALYFIFAYIVISVPFVFSGVCVSLVLTRFPARVGSLYAADLAGAASGCLAVIWALRVTDGPGAVIIVALLASLGAVFFAAEGGLRSLLRAAVVSGSALAVLAGMQAILAGEQHPLLRIAWAKGQHETPPLYEKWNSFSRVRVFVVPGVHLPPFGWGLSPLYPSDQQVQQLPLDIDAGALTVLTAFHGELAPLQYLKYDVTNVAHYIRHDAKVLVIGSGGGRDILSALVFGQKSVVAVEINRDIIGAVNQRFGDFSGHLDRDPRVTFVNDEARSYIARQGEKFDIIQASLIDTAAATAAGAFVLTENALYTVEAWKLFLDRLNPGGVLTVSRWIVPGVPAEISRSVALAAASLRQLGVERPRAQIVVVRNLRPRGRTDMPGIGTVLVSREPFSNEDLDTLAATARKMQFEVALSPRGALDPMLARIASGENPSVFARNLPLNITAPTDDNPFFFQMLRIEGVLNGRLWRQAVQDFNGTAVRVLGGLLIAVAVLTFACILVPLILTTRKETLRGATPFIVFFASIGFGFILVEISQMQRLIIYLGHPTYGLSVVLFTLLLSSGLGSSLTQKVNSPQWTASAMLRLALLLGALLLFGLLTPSAVTVSRGAVTALRILIAIAVLFPLGTFMGMAFPLGMKLASTRCASLTPWLWGINGATSVCASVVAVAIAMSASITAAFWTGAACYAVALAAFLWARTPPSLLPPDVGDGAPGS